MRKRILLLLAAILSTVCLGNAQTILPQTGYAIITPQGGSVTILSAVETTFVNATDLGFSQTDLAPSPLLTNAVLPVNIGATRATGTVLALVNPALNAATINLIVTNAAGVEILNRTITVGPGEQFSQFVSEFFVEQGDLTVEFPGLLTISSNIGIAAQALDFRGFGFTSVPITNLSGSGSTVNTAPFAVIPSFSGVGQIVCAPGTIGFTSIGCVPQTIGVAPSICIPSTTIGLAPIGCVPQTIGVAPTFTTRAFTIAPVTPPVTTVQLQPASIGGGSGTLIFPQVMTGPGINTSFTIGNASAVTQTIRIDVFNSVGDVIRTVSNIPIAPHGLIVFFPESIGVNPSQ